MKQKKATFTQSPFGNLQELLKRNNIKLRPDDKKYVPPSPAPVVTEPVTERELFLEAMSDVIPIEKNHYVRSFQPSDPAPPQSLSEKEIYLKKMESLINAGEGFVIAHTAEYMEGTNTNVHPEVTRLLHGGHFTIQDHIDLHGYNVETAKKAFDAFMKNSVATRKKGLLIVHGRGLSSPIEPVLKNLVYQWLSSGPWRKWVVAFSSARACDGGSGATYVLLRDRPAKKCRRKE